MLDHGHQLGERAALVHILDAQLLHRLLVRRFKVQAVDDHFLGVVGRLDDAGGKLAAGNLGQRGKADEDVGWLFRLKSFLRDVYCI